MLFDDHTATSGAGFYEKLMRGDWKLIEGQEDIRPAEGLLRREVSANLVLPVPIPARDTVELKNTD